MTTTTARPVQADSTTAYRILHLGFTVAPVLFGLDKFANLMVDWTQYLPGFVTERIDGAVVMGIVGVIEIVAGIGCGSVRDLRSRRCRARTDHRHPGRPGALGYSASRLRVARCLPSLSWRAHS